MTEKPQRKGRVLVIGASLPRLAKVMQLLLPMKQPQDDGESGITVEYVPCVASFDSYEGENGDNIRYLISVNYHGPDGTEPKGSSLAPFFDEEPTSADNEKPRDYLGILGGAVGVGIEESEDVDKIQAIFRALRAEGSDDLSLSVVQPNPEYSNMKEETAAFKEMSAEAKEEAALHYSIGPGKMAKFVHIFSTHLVKEILDQEQEEFNQQLLAERQEQARQEEEKRQQELKLQQAADNPHEMDDQKPRYACRKCRSILFGENDMQDPPHVPAKHKFSNRKMHHGGMNTASCQSYFLADSGLPWMGDMSDMEGRLCCPKCKTKVGTWNWAGAQCSCGTWVSPAVQIPQSKVDVLAPNSATDGENSGLPAGTIFVSPFVTGS